MAIARVGGKAAGFLNRTRDDLSKGFNANRRTSGGSEDISNRGWSEVRGERSAERRRRMDGDYQSIETESGRRLNISNTQGSREARSPQAISGAERKYGSLDSSDYDHVRRVAPDYFDSNSAAEALGKGIRHGGGNLQQSAIEGGHGSVLGMGLHHATRGAIGGGVAGGAIEAAQGGSFWDGAKGGMLNGAVGYGGYRMAGASVGAKGINPFGKGGMIEAAGNMKNLYSPGRNPSVSKAVTTTLQGTQMAGLARGLNGLQ